MSEENLELVRRQHAAFTDSGRFAAENAHPDVEWMAAREDPDAATHQGAAAIQRYFDHWTEMFEDMRVDALELIDAGDRAFAWVRFTGHGAGSGAAVDMQQAQVWTFREGKVQRVEEYFDRDEGLRAAGLEP
jgi:ketosteroid isomerase-like protein